MPDFTFLIAHAFWTLLPDTELGTESVATKKKHGAPTLHETICTLVHGIIQEEAAVDRAYIT
jgi:hypothetical protein